MTKDNQKRGNAPSERGEDGELRILLVEDDDADAELEIRTLRQEGMAFRWMRVQTGDDFIRALREFHPGIILSDYRMPQFDGMLALRLAQELAPGTPVIIITGSINEETAVECMKAGADDYVLKDRLARLVPSVRAALATRRLEAQKEEAEAQLRHSEARYRMLFERNIAGVFRSRMGQGILECNAAFARMFGFDSPEEVLREPVEAFYPSPDMAAAFRDRLLRERRLVNVETLMRRRDGGEFWVLENTALIDDEDGEAALIEGTCLDITEKKLAEETLRESEERMRLLVEGSHEFFFYVHDRDFKYSYISPSFEKITGHTISYAVGPHEPFNTKNPINETAMGWTRRVLEEGIVPPTYYYEMFHKNGGRIMLEIHERPVVRDGRVVAIQGIAHDVTERIRAERALMEGEERYRALADGMGEGLMRVDEEDRILYANAALCGMLGYTGQELVGRRGYEDLVFEEDREAILRHNADRARGISSRYVVRLKRKSGEALWAEISGAPAAAAGDFPAGSIGIITDITERRRAEEALRESEERYRTLVAQSPDGVFLADLAGRFLSVNERMCGQLGYAEAELLSMGIWDIVPERYRDMHKARLMRILAGERLDDTAEYEVRTREGEPRLIEVRSAPYWKGGRIVAFHGIARDITDQRRAESALRESEARAKALLDAPLEAIALIDPDGRALAVNGSMAARFGLLPSQMVGQRLLDLLPESVARYRESQLKLVLATREPVQFVDERGGRVLESSVFPVFGQDGAVSSLAIYSRDVTDLKKAEARLDLLGQAIEQAQDTIVLTDREGKILYVNPSFTRITGYSREEALGQNPRFLQSGLHGKDFYEDFWKTILSGQVWSGRFINRRKDGTLFDEEAVISPVVGRDGTLTAFVATKRDITQELALRRKLEESKKLETIGMVAGGVAHEVRNPLFAIDTIVTAMERKLSGHPEFAEYTAHVRDQVGRLSRLMDDLLTLGRPLEPSAFVTCLLRDVVGESIRDLCQSQSGFLGRCRVVVPEQPLPVRGVPARLSQVFTNLIQNALQMSGRESEVEVTIARHGETAVVGVSDSGPGIPDDLLPNLFEPFRSKRKGGTGLGLAIARKIVEAHGGALSASNNVRGPGATFTVRLPMEVS